VAEVDVAVGGAVLRISVRSRSAAPAVVGGQPAGATAGTGLLAMQERVSAFGGSCEHGWTADRTFRVQAAIPLQVDRP
jgi:signal transduction histidine kinase